MPHILIDGCHVGNNIESISLHVDVKFSRQYFKTPSHLKKLEDIQAELESVIAKYFPDYESDVFSNNEFNERMNNH